MARVLHRASRMTASCTSKTSTTLAIFGALVMGACAPSGTANQPDAAKAAATQADEIVVHMFNTPFAEIEEALPRLKRIGYTAVLTSPANATINATQWWGRYQPIGLHLGNPLGSEEDFRSLVTAANNLGISIVADAVFNHAANPMTFDEDPSAQDAGWRSFDYNYPPADLSGPDYHEPTKAARDFWTAAKLDIGEPVYTESDFHGRFCISWSEHERWNQDFQQLTLFDVQYGRICGGSGDAGLPDLAMTDNVLAQQQTHMRYLTESIGVKGFRFDAMKHMSTEYFETVTSDQNIANFGPNAAEEQPLVFGEIIASTPDEYDRWIKPYLDTTANAVINMRLYDFPALANLVKQLDPGGSFAALARPQAELEENKLTLPESRALNVVTTHDIPQNGGIFAGFVIGASARQNFFDGKTENNALYGDATLESLAYAFVLGKKHGVPMVYTDPGQSELTDIKSNHYRNAYCDRDLVRMVAFRRALSQSDEESFPFADDDHMVMARGTKGGTGLVLFNKGDSDWKWTTSLATAGWRGVPGTEYVDLLSGNYLVLNSEGKPVPLTGTDTVKPKSAALYLELGKARALVQELHQADLQVPEQRVGVTPRYAEVLDRLFAPSECR